MTIAIHQGNNLELERSDINIVIDVIRAFTVAHYAFLGGVRNILLVKSTDEAITLKKKHPHYLLAGEEHGIAIKGFDLSNSPKQITQERLTDKTLVQKTTNGVKATLHSLNTKHLFVTGFSNAKCTAEYVRKLNSLADKKLIINIIASHPTGDDDLACAEYIKNVILGSNTITAAEVRTRIIHSHVTQKFFDETNLDFDPEDIGFCSKEHNSHFIMEVNKNRKIPVIERKNV
ncbi:2-phosphosulfolactate phosphatase [Halalkalibacter alkaliphilus]|uniref:Probable 2-phosphosulfolactate phosphatase n=1 Tax=Halalkalibacter alkaliphilus TaxID=2917993 RepID=A0A9X1ZZS0_9BACI|nr:2-phosphosulfolactate phosphatase [Halalkalibacter alkaliphilus]MCL7746035.1 2-phosphosulfolactate phosphatase [Halalkalibacter alkaliphilus]